MATYSKGYEYCPRPGETLPPGFHSINVLLTEKEYGDFIRRAYWLGSGLASSAIREVAGLPENPRGIKKALADQRKAAEQ